MKFYKNKKVIVTILIAVLTVILISIFLIFRSRTAGGVYFDSSFNTEEQTKISRDLNESLDKQFNNGLRLEVRKDFFPNCTQGDKCMVLRVKYIYNQYGDNASGVLRLENGKYVFYPSL